MSVFLGKHRVERPRHILPGPKDSIAAAALQEISPDLDLCWNELTQRFEVWNSGGLVKIVEGVRGEYVEPGMWLAAQLQIPMEMQIRAIEERNRRLREAQLKKRRSIIEAVTSDRFWQKGFVAAITRDFAFVDKIFGWRKGPKDG